MARFLPSVALLLLLSVVSGCVPQEPPPVIMSEKTPVELRAMQSRTFETGDEEKVYRSILAVMLDLGYALSSVDADSKTITGTKLAQLTLTASIPASDEASTTVRANAIVKLGPQKLAQSHQVDDPAFYQTRFFEPLSKALFLDAMIERPQTSEAAQ